MKTYTEWTKSEESIDTFLPIGCQVDQDMVDFFAKVVEPVEMNSRMVQCGEAVGPKAGKFIFATFIKINSAWFFAGNHYRNDWTTARFVVDGVYQASPDSPETEL